MVKLAHSRDSTRGILAPQPYKEHVINVLKGSQVRLITALNHSKLPKDTRDFAFDVISLAATFHDFGKLDPQAQDILSQDYSDENDGKMLNHVDAGVALLLQRYESTKNLAYLLASFLVHAHHIGLQNLNPMINENRDKSQKYSVQYLYNPNTKLFRDNRNLLERYNIQSKYATVKEYIDAHLGDYYTIHRDEVGDEYIPKTNVISKIPLTAMQVRMMFSCLVDADHSDTDRFYSQNYKPFIFGDLQCDKRMEKLQSHIANVSKNPNASPERIASRKKLHEICLTSLIPNDINFFALDGSVGLGKTLSGATYMLRLARQRGYRRIYNIIPFTNIINQTVDVYRNAMLLDGEDKNNVNEIHSKCEFEKIWMRKHSNLWNAPINVSTAVQFFESLTSAKVGRCRKLHHFSNSVFFFDEFDKSIFHSYWRYILPILKDMAENFNCSFIFSSGTSAYYWDIFDIDVNVHDIIDGNTYQQFKSLEQKRVKIDILPTPLSSPQDFIDFVETKMESHNNGLIVCNTINNASLLAGMFRDLEKWKIYEMTGWQTPEHKERILDKIKSSLKTEKVLVVATSTIECGVDISFEIGWREKCSALNLFQFNGRINRNSLMDCSKVYVYEWDESLVGKGKPFTANPQNLAGIKVFDLLSAENLSPDKCSHIVELELAHRFDTKAIDFDMMEEHLQFREIENDFKVIDTATAMVIVDKDLIARLRKGDMVQYNEIVRKSVQLWFPKLEIITGLVKLGKFTTLEEREYYVWEDEYDEDTGIGKIMKIVRELGC